MDKKCPSCWSIEIRGGLAIQGIRYYSCKHCDYEWERPVISAGMEEYNTHHYPLELNEHIQYLKDGIKLTNQDKYDLQIDLWLYGKEVFKK